MGWCDSEPYENYHRDLHFVSERLEKNDLKIDAIWSSGLKRAQNTAEFYATYLGFKGYLSSDKLKEINYGKLTFKNKNWVKKHFPNYKVDEKFVYPKGESFSQMQKRSVQFVNELVTKKSGKNSLLVVHAGVIRAILCHYLNLPYREYADFKMGHRYIGVLDFKDAKKVEYTELGSPSEFYKKYRR